MGVRMPEWMRRFADDCTRGHLLLVQMRSRRSDAEAIASDWQAVGDDIREAMHKWGRDHGAHAR